MYRDENGIIQFQDGLDFDEAEIFPDNMLTTLYRNGKFMKEVKFSDVRQRIQESL